MTDENLNLSTGMPAHPDGEPGNAPEGEPGNEWVIPDAERLPAREVGTLSNPDF
jgi:hypothetical protein